MSMKKALDQTLRDIKRGVNKKVLKVPSVEQNVLDATSNEPWGPHGSLLADIAQASRNYHEYQMIMTILWKRINDIGKNWRHVYKALTVLEYLVAHGAERIIDDIKEHAYQISTLSDFQYIDSSGRDQGNNVRRKSQILVALVNDKERIIEVRQKAASNRDKFRSSSAVGGMYRPGYGGYGDDRYEGRYGVRDDDRNGYGREREWSYRDDERYGRYGDSNSREGDSYGRDSDDRYGRDSYGDDYSRGRSHSVDGYRYGSRSRSADRDGDRAFDEDDRHSSRGSSVKATEDQNINGRRLERKFSEQNLGAPPSYEDAVGVSRSPTFSERDGKTSAAAAAPLSPPAVGAAVPAQSSSPVTEATPQSSPAPNNGSPSQATTTAQADSFDEFDPRGPVSAAPSTGHNAEMDLLGSLADAFSPGPLAIMPASSPTSDFESTSQASNPTYTVVPSENTVANQSFEDPFGDSPFKAIPSNEPAQPHTFASTTSFQPAVTTLGTSNNSTDVSNIHSPPSQQFVSELQRNDLPPSGPFTPATQVPFSASDGQPSAGFGFMPQSAPPATSFHHMAAHNLPGQPDQLTRHNSVPFSAPSANASSNTGLLASNKMPSHQNNDFLGGFLPQASVPSTSTGSLALVPHEPVEKKFETKSSVWADTLNRGLVNLNISGSKINPLSNIGVDFESLNRKEKRMEKPSTTAMTSTVSMGKAMGSGSGMGRAGAGASRPLSNPMMGSHIGSMGMSVGAPPMGMGMGGAPMGMNMGMGPGVSMQRPQGSNTSNYPMMGRGGYPLQMYQYQYGGGYR